MPDLRHLLVSGCLILPLACSGPSDDASSNGGRSRSPATGSEPLPGPDGPAALVVRAGASSLPDPMIEHIFIDVDRVTATFVGEHEPRTIGLDLTIDLVELVNGRHATLGSTTSSGHVERVEIDVSCAEVRLADGTVIERRFPVHGPAHLELSTTNPLDTHDVFVQFDTDRSLFRVADAGDTPERMLVHLAARMFDGSRLSTIGGRVMDDSGTPHDPDDDLPIADTSVVLEQGGLLVAHSRTDRDGAYAFFGPYTGDFDVVCLPEARMPDARAIHATGPSVTGDGDFLFQVAESEGW